MTRSHVWPWLAVETLLTGATWALWQSREGNTHLRNFSHIYSRGTARSIKPSVLYHIERIMHVRLVHLQMAF